MLLLFLIFKLVFLFLFFIFYFLFFIYFLFFLFFYLFKKGIIQALCGIFTYLIVMGDFGFSPKLLFGLSDVWCQTDKSIMFLDKFGVAVERNFEYRLNALKNAQTACFVSMVKYFLFIFFFYFLFFIFFLFSFFFFFFFIFLSSFFFLFFFYFN